jgi:hypothetical protein
MEITKEFLLDELKKLKAEQEEFVTRVHVVSGLILACEKMLCRLDAKDDAISLDQLKDALGADSLEVVENGQG